MGVLYVACLSRELSVRNLKIAHRTLLCFGVIAALLMALGTFNLLQLSDIRKAGTEIENSWLPGLASADKIAINVGTIRLETLRLITTNDPAIQRTSNALVEKLDAQVQAELVAYEKTIFLEEDRQVFNDAHARYRDYMTGVATIQRLVAQQQTEQAAQFVVNTQIAAGRNLADSLLKMQQYNIDEAAKSGAVASSLYEHVRWVSVLVILVALVITAVLAWIMTGSIVNPIRQAVEVAKRIAGGDLSRAISVKGQDEAAELLVALSTMQDNLRSTIGQINDSAHQLSSAAEEMNAVMDESTRGLQRQNDEIEQAATAVNEMTAAVEDVATNAVSTSQASLAASQSAAQGQSQLSEAISSIQALTSDVLGASQQAEALATQTQNISKVLDVIRAVAEQTNLLALNAAIEAARAGDAGRGFAVVADEVRALAHRTGESTREIESMIDSIQQGTGQTVDALQTSAERARSTLDKANAAGQALSVITESVAGINDRNLLIASASEQQAQVAREVDRNLVSIRDLSVQTATGAQQTSAATQEVSRLATDLSSLVKRFIV
ncbi:methyl-accepting chemotaxis protein [Pseudomonas duriflava]|uniref:Methyl-accepting chemotaxis protein n=1 Tax=Pseudomonas duriflava TaxID=459528 RepID=A0A562QIG4_9PSED|nr:methyl-accepting chemotaxis protein [Pseudomonas duriflava]TWI56529.1 methyl-accepting chemotaxis protein [Pseudomonas duriflava]